VPDVADGRVRLHGWTATVSDDVLTVTGDGERDDWWRVAATAAWRHLDGTGTPVDVSGAAPPGTVGR
jgi:hypothetical protein